MTWKDLKEKIMTDSFGSFLFLQVSFPFHLTTINS